MKTALRTLLIVTALTLPSQAMAHPHEFVTMQITAQFTPDGKVAGFRYNWTFDEFFSAYALEGQDKNANGKAEQNELDALLKEILGNIGPISYFTKFEQGTVSPKFKPAIPISASMKKREVELVFDIPFTQPLDVKASPLTYAVYDDEFYIAMQHADAEKAVTLKDAPKNCDWKLDEPKPDDDVAAFAQSLDKTQSGGSDLGVNFAEWVTISCK